MIPLLVLPLFLYFPLQKTLQVTPVLTTKTLPLVFKAASTMPASMTTPRPTVAMVTTISNPPRPALTPDSRNAPVNLQLSSKLTSQDTEATPRVMPKNVIVVSVNRCIVYSLFSLCKLLYRARPLFTISLSKRASLTSDLSRHPLKFIF